MAAIVGACWLLIAVLGTVPVGRRMVDLLLAESLSPSQRVLLVLKIFFPPSLPWRTHSLGDARVDPQEGEAGGGVCQRGRASPRPVADRGRLA